MEYNEYVALRTRAMNEGWHHWQRIANSRDRIPQVEVTHCVPFQCQYDLEAPVKVLHPSPRFIGELMHGYIHPPIEAFHNQMLEFKLEDGTFHQCKAIDAPAFRAKHKPVGEVVIDNSQAHLQTALPMSYEDAINFCIMKDIPVDVWGKKHNKEQFAIIEKSTLPDRKTRNNWSLGEVATSAEEKGEAYA